ncbi:MAG: chromosomal replication initiator protein DnaA [Candidatus Parcubacteria bacterium]|nr:MAG: chromosomal replication initiator protein DnaA [Candidatus Parcubacteria bacterium]
MENNLLKENWLRILENLEKQIPKAILKTWFTNVEPFQFFNGVLKIAVPNKLVKNWLENKFNILLIKTAKEFLPDLKKIDYIIEVNKSQFYYKKSIFKKISYQQHLTIFETNPSTNLNPRYRFENFVIGSNNELAFAAAQGVVNNLGEKINPLFIYGGVGLGKTHLLQAIGNEVIKKYGLSKKVRYATTEQFTNDLINSLKNQNIDEFRQKFREIDVLILDDVHFLSGKNKSQEELFHTFNELYNLKKQIIFSSDRPPRLIPDIEERLQSRFEGGLIIDITPPDYETRLAILKIKNQEKSYFLSDQILELLAQKITKNIRELEGCLNYIAFKLSRLNNYDESKVLNLINEYLKQNLRRVSYKKILKIISEFYNIKEDDLIKKIRKKEVIKPRQILIYLLREVGKFSYSFIGDLLNKRDHTTILYSYEKIEKEIKNNLDLYQEIEILKEKILN